MIKLKEAVMILGLTTGACAAPNRSVVVAPAPQVAPAKGPETKLGKTPEALPFSMLGAPQEEVIQAVQKLLQALGPYSALGTQADGSVIECEIAPPKNADMAMKMAIGTTRDTLNQNLTPSEPLATPAPKPDKSTSYPDLILMGSVTDELSTGEIIMVVQTKRNPNAKPNK